MGRFSLSKKYYFNFYASCGSTHKIEFAEQIHKFREHGPGHPLLPLCGNSPCVSRNLYKGRKNVPARRGFSSEFDRKRGFNREAARKTIVFRQPQASQWDAFRFSDNPCFNFAKHKLSSISIMNLFAVIKIDLPQFLQIFLANKHYIIVCKDKVLIHSFDVVHIHKEALVAPQETRSRQFLLNLAELFI